MIPAGRYEMLQARKADMGADLSRAVMNSVVTQISNGWNPNGQNYFVVANDNGELASRLKSGLESKFTICPLTVEDNRMFNGDDDVAIIEGDNNQFQLAVDAAGKVVGTGVYTACATIVSLGDGYYEITGLALYRYQKDLDSTAYQRGSYIFCQDDSQKFRWYKIENVYVARGTTLATAAGDKTNNYTYLGDVIGICKKVVRIDGSYTVN